MERTSSAPSVSTFLCLALAALVRRAALTPGQVAQANAAIDKHKHMSVFVNRPRGQGAIAGKNGGWSGGEAGPSADHGHENPTARADLGVFGWGDDSQIFRDILSLPRMMRIVQGLCGAGFRMDHSPFCIRMQRGSEGQALHATSQPGSYDPLSHYQWNNGRIHCGLIVVAYQLNSIGPGDGGWCCK